MTFPQAPGPAVAEYERVADAVVKEQDKLCLRARNSRVFCPFSARDLLLLLAVPGARALLGTGGPPWVKQCEIVPMSG